MANIYKVQKNTSLLNIHNNLMILSYKYISKQLCDKGNVCKAYTVRNKDKIYFYNQQSINSKLACY